MKGVPPVEEDEVQSHDSTLEDYSRYSSLTNHQLQVLKNFDLLELTAQQQQVARGVILKESDTFTLDDTEIGDVDNYKVNIQSKDRVQVQKNYNRIPKPLFKEIKEYVEDMLNRDWIVRSESTYYLPVVAVTKNNGTFRLCFDY